MATMPIAQAKAEFAEVVRLAEAGEPVFITRGVKKRHVAAVVPIDMVRARSGGIRLGLLERWGEITLTDEWAMTDEELVGLHPDAAA